jgi:protein-S-isoprenylcysteine O-methyltransferase Ste14
MLDREQRALLVVPYSPPPPPRRHMVVATAFLFLGSVAALGLAMADYSAATTASLIVAATVALSTAVVLFILGLRARHRFRREMERAIEPVPVQPVDGAAKSVEAV